MRALNRLKIIFILMTIMTSLMIVVSCNSASTPTPTPTEGTIGVPDQPIRIDLWHIQGAGGGPQYIENSVNRFLADNPGVGVEVSLLLNDPYKTEIRTAMENGNPPCVFPTWGGGPLYEYIQDGLVVDLTEMMSRDSFKDRFVDASLNSVTFDGRLWGVPVENTAIAVVFYNKAIFEEYGLTPPQTYDEMLSIIDTLTRAGIAPFALANKTKWPGSMHYMYIVNRLGGSEVFYAAASRNGGSFEDPVFIRAGEMLQDLVRRGAFVEGFNDLNHDDGQSRALLYSGEAAMELMGTWNIPIIRFEYPEFYESNLDFFTYPIIEGGAGHPNNVIGTIGDHFYHISTACEHSEEAFELIQYLVDDDSVAERVAYGRIPPVKGLTIDAPILQEVISVIQQAPDIQLWYDQYLPSELGEIHKDAVQELLSLTMTPQEAAETMENAARRSYDE